MQEGVKILTRELGIWKIEVASLVQCDFEFIRQNIGDCGKLDDCEEK